MKYVLPVLLLCSGFTIATAQQDAKGIIAKMDATIFSLKDKTVYMRMVMINLKSGKEKEKEAVLMQKGNDRKFFRYTAPDSDSGISTLSLPNGEIYVYLPMLKTPKKITNMAESGVFNNSDFSIDDMANQTYSERYDASMVRSDGERFVIRLTPGDAKPVWDHIVVHINKQHYYPEQFDYYSKSDDMDKQAQYKFKKVSGFWVASEVSMEDLEKQSKTILYMLDISVNTGLSDDIFTVENMVPEGR